jgi:DNA replication protein DnaC
LGGNLAKWESFDWDRHPKLRPAKRVIVDWYNGLPDSGALVLAGDVGCGKTHLANAIADLYGRWRMSFYEEIALIKHIQDTYGDKAKSEEKIFRDLFRPSLLILDDLGTYQSSNASFLSNVYNRLFNEYLSVMGKPVLITTNIPMFKYDEEGEVMPGGLEDRIGVRSFSRLCDALGKFRDGRYIDLFGIEDMRVEGYLE